MITSFNTSRENASSTDASPTIREPGKYICTIIEADTFDRSPYQFVRFLLENEQKQRATLELSVVNPKTDWQKKQFDALCVCAKVMNPNFVKGNVKNHRRGRLENKVVEGYRCRELENKRIGVVLQRVWRDWINWKDDGSYELREDFDFRLVRPFDAETERTASEIIKNVEKPEKLAASIPMAMKDVDNRKGLEQLLKESGRRLPAPSHAEPASSPAAQASAPVYDEDCPF